MRIERKRLGCGVGSFQGSPTPQLALGAGCWQEMRWRRGARGCAWAGICSSPTAAPEAPHGLSSCPSRPQPPPQELSQLPPHPPRCS